MDTASLIATICSIITTLCTAALTSQIYLLKKQIKADHDRSRREKTVESMMTWSNTIRRETSVAESIVEQFTFEQCKDLYNRRAIIVNKDILVMVKEICPDCKFPKKAGGYLLEGEALNFIRWHVISYLNLLESTLTSWKLELVDREIIENQFSFLYNEARGWNILEQMRNASDGFPVIAEFLEKLKENHRNQTHPRDYLPTG